MENEAKVRNHKKGEKIQLTVILTFMPHFALGGCLCFVLSAGVILAVIKMSIACLLFTIQVCTKISIRGKTI